MTRLVVLAWGNPSRGDDALGPEFLCAVEAMQAPPGVELAFVTDFQLSPEHALDLAGRDLALFVDASTKAAAPLTFAAVAFFARLLGDLSPVAWVRYAQIR